MTLMPFYIAYSLAKMFKLYLQLCIVLITFLTSSAWAQTPPSNIASFPEKVHLQLKWFNQFQFAGYYAAIEKGYYAEEGLDVEIKERILEKNFVKQVTEGESEYGVGDSGLVSQYAKGEPIVVLAAIFQHSPLVFFSRHDSGITSPYEMKGKRVMSDMVSANEAPLRAMMSGTGISERDYTLVNQENNYGLLIEHKIDVISGYITDEPYFFKKNNLKINIINPQNYGIDFYGDMLFTSQTELQNHPGRAERFRRASNKGWNYALEHPEEIIQIISKKYHSQLSIENLRFEAVETRKLILPDVIPLGTIRPERMRQVSDTYANSGFNKPLNNAELAAFIYKHNTSDLLLTDSEKTWLANHPVIHVGIDHDFAPYEWIDKNGHYVGMAADYMHLLENKLGVHFEIIKDKSWPEILSMAKRSELDMVSFLVKTDDRSKYLIFAKPFKGAPVVIVDNGQGNFIGSLDQLNGKRVALEKGYFLQELLQKDYPNINLVLTTNTRDALNLVFDGKADAYLGDAALVNYVIKKEGLLSLRFSGQTNYVSQNGVAVTKNNPELSSIISKALATLPEDKTEEIYNRWLGLNIEVGIRPETLIKYGVAFVILMMVFGYWIFRMKREISTRKNAENELRIAATAFESQEGMIVTDANNRILRVNKAFTSITGYKADDVVGQTPRLMNSDLHDKTFFEEMRENLNQNGSWEGELLNRRKSGEVFPEHITITAVKDTDGIVTNYVESFTDITKHKAASDEIKNLAYYDPLTKLPNRRLLLDRLNQALDSSAISGKRGALLFIDLDHFKTLNDSLGHNEGDILLQQVASRLSSGVRDGDTVARLGGDEFVVLLEDLSEHYIEAAAFTEKIAENILDAFNQPYQLNTNMHHSTPSIGATLFNGHENAKEELLKQADIAMYQAKSDGRNTLRFFDPKVQASISTRVDMERDLRKAIKQNEFQLHYQIQVGSLGQALGAEALIRWLHPERGMIFPLHFIPLAEDTGLILPIGQWVLDTACSQLNRWQQSPLTQNLVISVNVSAKQFFKMDFVEQVEATIQRYEINPACLKLELTESMLVDNISDIIAKMNALSKVGVRFSLDDFGTGYSSLQYLKKLPLNQLKIDRSFVRDIAEDSSDRAIVRTIITMANSLEINVIAEGVETIEQRQFLLDNGCTNYQGYLYGKPVPIDEFEALLKKI
jgi:diguanylate cyclase (GGDEF)-like protein/PAS domain S-box-containing protein